MWKRRRALGIEKVFRHVLIPDWEGTDNYRQRFRATSRKRRHLQISL
jgi:hypothetical protein